MKKNRRAIPLEITAGTEADRPKTTRAPLTMPRSADATASLIRAAIKQLRIDGHPAPIGIGGQGVTCFYTIHLNETIGLLEEALASAEGRNFPRPLGAR